MIMKLLLMKKEMKELILNYQLLMNLHIVMIE